MGEAIENKTVRYLNTEEAAKILTNISNQYQNKIGMYRETLVYLGDEKSEYGKAALESGYIVLNMDEEEFKYYIELGVLEDSVKENKSNKIGRELCTNEFSDSIKIGNNTYTNGWFLIGNYTDNEIANDTYKDQYTKLGLTDVTHAPYLVNYGTGEVLSVNGMKMYQSETIVHTFANITKLVNAITYVDSMTENTGEYYGNLYSTSLYTGPVDRNKAVYDDNDGLLEYDENGALILDKDNAIPVLEVNQKYKIDDAYSISVTVEGNIYQSSMTCKTIVALSNNANNYIAWIGFYKGYLHVYSFNKKYYEGIDEIYEEDGFTSIDISKYEGKVMNIQVTAVRLGKTKVYINGEKIIEFNSGSEQLEYQYITIGDLRVGRNLKFFGKIYDFALYGVELSEDEVKENWENSKKYVE